MNQFNANVACSFWYVSTIEVNIFCFMKKKCNTTGYVFCYLNTIDLYIFQQVTYMYLLTIQIYAELFQFWDFCIPDFIPFGWDKMVSACILYIEFRKWRSFTKEEEKHPKLSEMYSIWVFLTDLSSIYKMRLTGMG